MKKNRYYLFSKKYFPGGVNSPVRAFKAVNQPPVFVKKALGTTLYSQNGEKYYDFINGWGALILGHGNKRVNSSAFKQLKNGSLFGLNSIVEAELADRIISAFPSIELLRFTVSGTEAVMTAIRLAKAFRGKRKIIKFEGCYHGHLDYLLSAAGSGLATCSIPTSGGVFKEQLKDIIVLPFNDLKEVKKTFAGQKNNIAAVIIEPIAGNMGVIAPQKSFLQELKNICEKAGALLIFDEIITGFRASFGGAQAIYKTFPDLTCLGKIIGGGFPIGAVGGRKEILKLLAPEGDVYHAGTFAAHPVSMAAGSAAIDELKRINPYKRMKEMTGQIADETKKIASKRQIPLQVNRSSSMFTFYFNNNEVYDFKSAKNSDVNKYAKFFALLKREGILLPPSQFESCFLSAAYDWRDVEKILSKINDVFKKM